MSRSYKKNPVMKSTNCKKKIKRRANKKVRKADIDNGGSFKKVSDSWEINDYISYGFCDDDRTYLKDYDNKTGKVRK